MSAATTTAGAGANAKGLIAVGMIIGGTTGCLFVDGVALKTWLLNAFSGSCPPLGPFAFAWGSGGGRRAGNKCPAGERAGKCVGGE